MNRREEIASMRRIRNVITDEHTRVYRDIEKYFELIQREIDAANDNLLAENCNLLLHPHFERRVRGTRPLEWQPDALPRPEDAVHMLLYKDKVVAVVTESRDSWNYVQFSFFDHLEKIHKSR
jgi:hypothetical protein